MAAGITVPMGGMTITAGVADSDTGESSSGATLSTSVGGGTLVVGYSTQTLKTAEKSTAAVTLKHCVIFTALQLLLQTVT